jgi:hypothetical protein
VPEESLVFSTFLSWQLRQSPRHSTGPVVGAVAAVVTRRAPELGHTTAFDWPGLGTKGASKALARSSFPMSTAPTFFLPVPMPQGRGHYFRPSEPKPNRVAQWLSGTRRQEAAGVCHCN